MAIRSSWHLKAGDELAPGVVVQRRLGGGSRFEVYLVTDDRRACVAVAKVLRPDVVDDRRAGRALEREARCLRTNAHPNIVRAFDVTLDGPRPHLLLEYLDGPTLRSLVQRFGPLSVEQVVPMGLAVASALHFLHGSGWVHLDVKPSNVIMGASATLVDLSVARKVERASKITGRVGTAATMAPEQLDPAALGPIGPPSDIWGLGKVLEHALGSRTQRMHGLRVIVNECLAPEPALRPAAADVIGSLEPLVSALLLKPELGNKRPRLVAR